MTTTDPHSALRELRAHLTTPFVLAAQAGIALILGFSGPFETWTALTAAPRLAYWAGVVFGTYALGAAVTVLVVDPLEQRGLGRFGRVALGGALIGVVVSAFLAGMNLSVFGTGQHGGALTPEGLGLAFLVSWVVMGLRAIKPRPAPAPVMPAGGDAAPQAPALLRRLPVDRRGRLIALSVQDHYVEIATTGGRTLVLMRLSDAIAETTPVPGVQIHRSHWVALDQVRAARRQGDGAVLTLTDGQTLPVSRGRLADVRAAGLLP